MSKLYAVEAMVIRARDFGEADKILTLYTREQGKIQAIAKGVKKATSRLRGGVQPFAHVKLLMYRGKTLDTVTQSENIRAFSGLREDLVLLAAASYLSELLDAAVPEREPHEEIFLLAVSCLGLLEILDPEQAIRYFELHLLDLLGYRPLLSGCITCGRSLAEGSFFLHPESGGLVCLNCARGLDDLSRVAPGTAMTMERLMTMDPAGLPRLKISAPARSEMDIALGKYLEYHLDKKFKARAFLKEVLVR